jgi:DNA-directed RNA polymerase
MSNILDTFAEITGATRKAILEKVGVAELQKNESVFRTLILDELERDDNKNKINYNESRPAIKVKAVLTTSESQILKKIFPEFKNFDP